MRRTRSTAIGWLAVSVCGGLIVTQACTNRQQHGSERPYTRLATSPTTTAHGAQFRAETEDRWDTMGLSVYPVDIRLRITNRSDGPLLLPFGDTFGLVLYGPDGAEHPFEGGRNGTRPVMRPLLLEPGEDYSIVRPARLESDGDRGGLRLVYEDGTGSVFTSDPLSEGTYSLRFWYSVGEKWSKALTDSEAGLTVWQGEVRTDPVQFEVRHP